MSDVGLLERAKRRLIGPPEKIPQRVITLAVVLAVTVAVAGAYAAVNAGLESASSSSLPYLRPVLQLATSVWAWLIGLIILLRRILVGRDKRYAQQAAEVTGYETREVRRLAYEATTPDGSTRVIASTGDEPDEIEASILEALETGEDDTMSLNPDAFDLEDDGDDVRESGDELDVGMPDLGDDAVREPIERRQEDDVSRWRSLAGSLARVMSVVVAGAFGAGAWHAAVSYGPELGLGLLSLETVAAAKRPIVYAIVAVLAASIVGGRYLRRWWAGQPGGAADGSAGGTAGGTAGGAAGGGGGEDLRDPWLEELKLVRLDLASTLNFSEIAWQLLLPAVATSLLLLIGVQLWVQPWLYPAILAAGLLVGIGNYLRISWRRSRRLRKLRQERERVTWSDVSILVKEVETPGKRVYYAWMGDSEPRRYAHDDREEFAEQLSRRAYELVEGLPVSPSVMEKQATELEKLHPDLHGFRDDEKQRIMRWLLDAVEESRHGLVPKAKLIEDAIEHDVESRRFAPGRRGTGYDPDMVREAYRELVPAALVEQEIDVSREDVDGDQEEDLTVTAVRLRSDSLPPELGQIRAAFSSRFGNYARWSPLYELPDVEDRLEEEPEYVSALHKREGAPS